MGLIPYSAETFRYRVYTAAVAFKVVRYVHDMLVILSVYMTNFYLSVNLFLSINIKVGKSNSK